MKSNKEKFQLNLITLIIIMLHIACGSETSRGNSKLKDDSDRDNEVSNKKIEEVKPIKEDLVFNRKYEDGLALLIGDKYVVYDSDGFETDISISIENLYHIDSISTEKFSDGGANKCDYYPYVLLSGDNINGWVSGKFVYKIENTLTKSIEIFDKEFSILQVRNYGEDAIDSAGLITGCDQFSILILQNKQTGEYKAINLQTDNPIYSNYRYAVLNLYDKIESINQDSAVTILRIKTEEMEGGKYYDLILELIQNGHIEATIENIEDWYL